MLYALLVANVLAIVFGDQCYDMKNASACFTQPNCGWMVSNDQSCGQCIESKYNCSQEAKFQCALRCEISDVPSYAIDYCGSQDNITCGQQCSSQLQECYVNETCLRIANATWMSELSYSQDAGCESLSGFDKDNCKDDNQVFVRALNDSLRTYCWGSANTANADACTLYKNAVKCFGDKCSDDCDDCSNACRSDIIDCQFDEYCSVALLWLLNEISEAVDDGDVFFPYKLKDSKTEYCSDSATSVYCNSYFDAVWSCLVNSCLESGCAYSQCNSKFTACYEDSECQAQLYAVLSKYPIEEPPGITAALIGYFCKIDSEIACDNTNFQALLNCYGGKCCWDPDICEGADQLEGCHEPDCLEESCVEVKCLPEFRDCMNDDTCSEAFVKEIKWSTYCVDCMERGKSASYCTANNSEHLNCSSLDGTNALFYMQYYCWSSPDSCNDKFSDLLHCAWQKCEDCTGDNEEDNSESSGEGTSEGSGKSDGSISVSTSIAQNGGSGSSSDGNDELNAAECACLFGDCWAQTEECMFDKDCWNLIAGNYSKGYGLKAAVDSVIVKDEDTPLVPTLVDTRLRQNYCGNKECNEKFWNLWYCIWPPIYMGPTYKTTYWRNYSTGCALSQGFYKDFPECVLQGCMGYADDCLHDLNSQCHITFNAAYKTELNLCSLCDEQNSNCTKSCISPSEFKTKYTTRCGETGSECPQDYRNLANCLYKQCADQTETLPGAQEANGAETTTLADGIATPSSILALILSAVLLVLNW